MATKDFGAGEKPVEGIVEQNIIEDGPIEGVALTSDNIVRRMSVIPGIAEITDGAIAGTEAEKRMGIGEGLRLYPKAVGWSILLSTAIIMEGYDVVLLGNFYGFPPFQRQFGNQVPGTDTYQLTAAWQAGLSNGANVGEILGLFITGIIAEKIGYRYTMIGALSLVICFIFINFFATNVQTLLVGEILCGIPWGVFQTLTTTYAAEVMPVPLRCYLCTYVNLCWVLGQFIASGVLRGLLSSRTDQWAYRIPFALQWIWPVPIIVGVFLAPESPWWLVRKGRIDKAKHSLIRLTSPKANPDFNADDTVAMMIHTDELEKELSAGTSYWDCFKGVDLRRTEIVSFTWAIQALCGSAFMGYSTYFYEQAGLATENAFNMNMAQYALGAVGTISSWFMMSKVGRRTIYVWGLAGMSGLMLVIACLGVPAANPGLSWAIGSMLLLYTFTYDLTVGPVCYSLVAELSSTRLRQKSIVIARNFYNFWGIINNIWTPYMLNPTAWNWGAKSGFFWLAWTLACLTWTFFRLPEPKGRTYGELDILFENRVSARKFRTTDATQFHGMNLRMASISEGAVRGGSFMDASTSKRAEMDKEIA